MSMDEFLDDVRLIMQSDPDALVQFATQWQLISSTLNAQGAVIDRAIVTAQSDSQGAMAQQLGGYRALMLSGVSALSTSSGDVASALRDVAPRIKKVKQDLEALLLASTLVGLTLAVPESVPATVVKLTKTASGSVSIMSFVSLVNDYHVAMATLATAMSKASGDFLTLDALQRAGGALPAAPHVTP
jgi:hypothetical protein